MFLGVVPVGHEVVVSLGAVVLVKVVQLYDVYYVVGISRVRGIAARLQAFSPTAVVGGGELEEHGIALVVAQELAVVLVALLGVVVSPEALAYGVIVHVDGASFPSMAFYAEVVVAHRGKAALSRAALEKALGQGYARGYAVALHLLYRQVLKLADV